MADNKEAIKVIRNEVKCIMRAIKNGCNSPKCAKCDLVMTDNEIIDGMTRALRCLEREESIKNKILADLNAMSYETYTVRMIDADVAISIVKKYFDEA